MPGIANPFVALVPRTMTKQELVQAVRVEITGELEAQLLYEAHAAATDDEVARTVFRDIANEEKEHMGELLALLQHLDPGESGYMAEGVGEVAEMMEDLGVDPSSIRGLVGTGAQACASCDASSSAGEEAAGATEDASS